MSPAYEAMVDVGQDAALAFPWSMDVVAYYQARFIRGWGLANARRLPGAGDIQQILGAVRTGLLNFTLEIEAADPDAGEASAGEESVPLSEISRAFHVYVSGDHNVVNAAGRDARQTVTLEGEAWDALRHELQSLGLPETELSALGSALTDDAPLALPVGAVGPAAAGWLARVNHAIATGVLSLPSAVAAGAIATELLKFLGAG